MKTSMLSLAALRFGVNALETDDILDPIANGHHSPQIIKRADALSPGYVSPTSVGGNMFFRFEGQPNTKPEPINIIISGNSDFPVPARQANLTNYAIFNSSLGFSQYLSALNFSDECLGLHLSTPAYAKISSSTPQLLDFLYRENFGDYPAGTCRETAEGGFHFRGWRQSSSNAYFLAASQEMDLAHQHNLVPDGYNKGKYEFVARALRGGKDYFGCVWPPATVTNITDLVTVDVGGDSGMYNHNIGIDGLVALVVVGKPVCGPGSTVSGLSGTGGSSSTGASPGSTAGSGATGSSTNPVLPAGNKSGATVGTQLTMVTLSAALLLGVLVL